MRYLPLLLLPLAACGDPKITSPFTDAFERAELGADYYNTGGPYRIEGGRLSFANAHNHPLWLKRRLPPDVRVDFDVTPLSPDGDVKVELFGDGKTFESDEAVAKDLQYTASGYVFIFGGWRNRLSTLVKQREHAWQYERGVPVRQDVHAEPGRTYHWTIFKRGSQLVWFIDGQRFLAMDDPTPLQGEGHDRFGFTGWEAPANYDNLRIAPLGPADALAP